MRCECGNDKFFGHQLLRADIIVSENGEFDANIGDNLESNIYDSETPYGPFECTKCGKVYESLK